MGPAYLLIATLVVFALFFLVILYTNARDKKIERSNELDQARSEARRRRQSRG